jgi:septal ring factor EnvC (AmiA/AmiB activator)
MQTASAEHIESFKASEVKRLTEESWKLKISGEHLRSTIPRLEDLIKKAQAESEPLQKELDALDPADKTRETREKRKTLEKKLENARNGIAYCEKKIEEILKQVDNYDEQSQAQLKRAQFMEEHFPALLTVKTPEVVEPAADEGVKAS